ncbi:MAG TPA: AAA family ATPase, partial [Candidatus Limnocylindria bacterium]|nr:AAA family ATPase [Candidatus Limnocylindria bacterium]
MSVLVMCGMPVSGKTTTAARLHAAAGGTLIRSCDVYRSLGIVLPHWVRRTRGFTVDVAAYDAVRDAAYREMGRRLDAALEAAATPVIVDAVHGERDKRRAVWGRCRAHGVRPVLVWCHCDDGGEIAARLAARRGRDAEPEHEASDRSVFDDIARRWQDPRHDGTWPVIARYDTGADRL